MITDDVVTVVMQHVAENYGQDIAQIKPESKLIEDLGLDSLDHAELMMTVEERFGVEVPDDTAMQLKTPDDIAQFIEQYRRNR